MSPQGHEQQMMRTTIRTKIAHVLRSRYAAPAFVCLTLVYAAAALARAIQQQPEPKTSSQPSRTVPRPTPAPTVQANGDALWQDVQRGSLSVNQTEQLQIAPAARTVKLNRAAFLRLAQQVPLESNQTESAVIITLPLPDGGFASFRLEESPVLPATLASKYPELKSYRGEALDGSGALMRCDWSPRGLHATILNQDQWISIYPMTADNTDYYVSAFGSEVASSAAQLRCEVDEAKHLVNRAQVESNEPENVPSGPVRRTYRLALATTVEYTNNASFGGGSVAATMATLNTWVNALNVIYERELSVRFVLAANNDQVIFTAEPDGLTGDSNSAMVDEIRPLMNSKLGAGNYDLGQVLSPGSGGLAYIGVVCANNFKAGGVSRISAGVPIGTGYNLITLAHEIGHQFSARHTFSDTLSSACSGSQFPLNTAVESFGGMTIMSYAEACTRIVAATAPHFHSVSYVQMAAYMNSAAGGCATTVNTGNQTPTLNVGANYKIPKQTPFTLTAVGGDPDSSDVPNLKYSWEQTDPGLNPPSADGSTGPLFRPFAPTSTRARTFPSLTYILNNANVPPDEVLGLKTAEMLPTVARAMDFACVVRDGRGGVNFGEVTVTVANAGPFLVTSPNTATTWSGGTAQTVTWSVSNTNAAPINCANVNILLSTDAGNSFPYLLAHNVPNSGSASVNLPPGLLVTQARIKVESVGNIFFDISDVNFTLMPGDSCPVISSIEPAIGAVGASITLKGVNLTGVTAVKFANNVNAVFTVNSDTQITATVPSGAVSGALTLSKASCPDKTTGAFALSTGAEYVLQTDDGSIENSSRFSGAPQFYYVNRLTPTGYPSTLTAISLFIPNSVVEGTDYKLVVATNPSGNSNINGLSLQEYPIKTPSRNQFVNFPVPNVTINAGDFVVGFVHAPQDGVFPVGIDTNSTVQNRSYVSGNSGATFDVITTRNYAIRAVIAPGATCSPQTCNTAPTIIASTLSPIAQGSVAKTTVLASVSDAETAAGNLIVTTGALPAGITVANITNTNGIVSAALSVGCGVSLGSVTIPLTVTDGGGLTNATNVAFTVSANTPPVLGTLGLSTLNIGGSAQISPTAQPSDNGTLKSIVASAPNFTGTFSVNPANGVVSINNAGPVGQYTVTITATDNCDVQATTQFMLAVIQAGAALEGDVTPRTTGNGAVTISDWTQVGRFVAGLDSFLESSEFQRTDCAPRATFGDAKLTVADWVQSGRYAAGLDSGVSAAGPTTPTSSFHHVLTNDTQPESIRVVRAVGGTMLRGQVALLPLQFSSSGNENALGFTVNFDPKLLSFYRATTSPGTTLTLNDKQPGQLGVLLARPVGQSFRAGDQTIVQLEFIPNGGEDTVLTRLRFSDQVVQRAAADTFATALPELSFVEADITISGRAAANVSAASYLGVNAAADSIVSAFGARLAALTQTATTSALPSLLGGTRVTLTDSRGVEKTVPLFFVSPNQVNYLVPDGLAEGLITVAITNGLGEVTRGLLKLERVAPSIFTADASGKGYAAADVQLVGRDGTSRYERVARYDLSVNRIVGNPIEWRADEEAFLVLYATGIKQRSALTAVKARVGGNAVEVLYAGAQGQFAGLDQINVRLPATLRGRGELIVELEVDGHLTNPVQIFVK
ncbi:MAG TPA: M12 family metallo-peptidase [Blastocatellia bacterium]|nr:M12 family metallo-peptidase [Blastocatellia bacterium]